jgi:hypothetical protein
MKVSPVVLVAALVFALVGTVSGEPPAAATSQSAAAEKSAAPAIPPAQMDYRTYIAALLTPHSVTELVQVMDRLVDDAEQAGASGNAPIAASAETSLGLQMQYRVVESKEAVMVSFVLSRGGLELKISDAVKIVALFADRAGLLHPVDVREGEKPVFYAQWLIKASEWKDIRKGMLNLRARNRAEKDLIKAFVIAVTREQDARQTTRAHRE